MKVTHNDISDDDLEQLFNLIYSQTKRIGDLLKRFNPIVSSRGKESSFVIYDRIKLIFEDLHARLESACIRYTIDGNKYIRIYGDAIHFDQVFYNLVVNSIYAINHAHKQSGTIKVDINYNDNNDVIISFCDDGSGIPEGVADKIFEPFFSTREPTSDEGGKGLGLFIVWNILKMFNGHIFLDKQYIKGTKFNIFIPKQEEQNE